LKEGNKITHYEFKNYTEILAYEALQEYLRNNRISCTCEHCIADIMALTLNRLPPRYFVTLRGELILKSESQDLSDQARVMADVVRAVQQVNAKPSHSIE
jgi:competence protein ComFB